MYALKDFMAITMFFFFQAEDGIRDTSVTGVQTCALPIFLHRLLVDAQDACELDENVNACSVEERQHVTRRALQKHVGCGQNLATYVALASHLQDRKSTRLNSSHRCISYAVFCLKKKKKKK